MSGRYLASHSDMIFVIISDKIRKFSIKLFHKQGMFIVFSKTIKSNFKSSKCISSHRRDFQAMQLVLKDDLLFIYNHLLSLFLTQLLNVQIDILQILNVFNVCIKQFNIILN